MKLIKCLFILIASNFFQEKGFGQVNGYKQLVNSSTIYAGLFVCKQPLKEININIKDTSIYIEYLMDVANYKINNKSLRDLISESKYVDTSFWLSEELKKSIVVKDKEAVINVRDVSTKFKFVNKKKFKFYLKEVNKYNNTNSFDKSLTYLSRPIFDSTKEFVIIQHDDGHSGLSGGGAITLFHLVENEWKEIGNISTWRY